MIFQRHCETGFREKKTTMVTQRLVFRRKFGKIPLCGTIYEIPWLIAAKCPNSADCLGQLRPTVTGQTICSSVFVWRCAYQ